MNPPVTNLDPMHMARIERRMAQYWPELERALACIYGSDPRYQAFVQALRTSVFAAAMARPADLVALDDIRQAVPDWIQRSGQSVYCFYVDRFAGDLKGVAARTDYLADMGVQWLHPLPLLRPRPGDSDGGFAVADYRQVDPRLGTMDDLEALTCDLRARGMGMILDVVCNHTAMEHDWAQKARAGDPDFKDYYIVLPDQAAVADWERDLIDVFPTTAPGSFTYNGDMGGWVWTTFYPFQWDLNYANPAVFAQMLEVLIHLAAKGVQGFRLDSAPFLWKQKGTSCRNLPQAYAIIEAWRAALSIVAPGVVLLAEAIESLDDVLPFFGKASKGCDLAYNNGVMTALWASLADQDANLFAKVLAKAAQKPKHAAWLHYVRCHDDLIWNTLSQDAPRQDLDRWSRFYGHGHGFSTGRAFQSAAGGVPSTNGMTAALVGLAPEQGPHDVGVKRLIMLYGIIHALDGWPLIYMGDEIGLGDNTAYASDPLQALDGRWLHRPAMDWAAANRRKVKGSVEAVLFDAMAHFAKTARDLDAKGIGGTARPILLDQPEVLAFVRDGGARSFLCLANLSEQPVAAALPRPWQLGATNLLTGETVTGPGLDLAPYAVIWLAA